MQTGPTLTKVASNESGQCPNADACTGREHGAVERQNSPVVPSPSTEAANIIYPHEPDESKTGGITEFYRSF